MAVNKIVVYFYRKKLKQKEVIETGRPQKYGEESSWVNIRVPRSKIEKYRVAIKKCVEELWAKDCSLGLAEGTFESATINASKYRSFEDFVEEIHEQESKIKKNR